MEEKQTPNEKKNKKSEMPLSLQVLNCPYDMGEHGASPLARAITALIGCYQENTDFGNVLTALRIARESLCMNYVAKCHEHGLTGIEISDEFFDLNSKASEDLNVDGSGEIYCLVLENCKKCGFGETLRYLLSLIDFCFVQGASFYMDDNPDAVKETLHAMREVHGI